MNAPLFKYGLFDLATSFVIALLIGIAFGFILERAGFGSAKKLVSQFYFKDFTVLKVMFTSIVVAMLGLLYFDMLGWIDMSKVYVTPTFIWPQLIGGLVLGFGFALGGY